MKLHMVASASIRAAIEPTIIRERKRPDQRPPWRHYATNIDVAAQYLAFDAINRGISEGKGKVSILRPDGGLTGLSSMMLEPPYDVGMRDGDFLALRKSARVAGAIPNREVTFGLASLKLDFWHLPFLYEEVFSPPHLTLETVHKRFFSTISIVDWSVGNIDLNVAKTVLLGIEKMRDAYLTLKPTGFSFPKTYAYEFEDWSPDLRNVAKLLAPYEGCTVVVPTVWLSYFDEYISHPNQRSVDTIATASLPPKEAILNLLEQEPHLKKADVHKELFPGISSRKFEGYWVKAVEERADISKPGRKPKGIRGSKA